jgi:hypothetical protein
MPSPPDPVVIRFEPPAPLLNMNDRMHHMKRSRLVKTWREAAYWYACEQLPGGPKARRLVGKQRVQIELPVKGKRARDPMNFVSTAKCVIDGMTDADLWPSDSEGFVTVAEPTLRVGGTHVVVTISRVL